ncbi:MAG: FlgD immunoglobulin-like domain containing protein, partial [bacterium]
MLDAESAIHADGDLLELSVRLAPGFDVKRDLKINKKLFASRSKFLTSSSDHENDLPAQPEHFSLLQNYPNPFNLETLIKFNLPAKSKVQVKVYNLRGELVRTLMNEETESGQHNIVWDGRNSKGAVVASGTYIYRIKAGNWKDSKMMILAK